MRVLHDNVLVTEADAGEQTTDSGLIIQGRSTTGHKPAVVIACGEDVDLNPNDKVYLDWTKAMPVELDGLKCGVIKFEEIKLVIGD